MPANVSAVSSLFCFSTLERKSLSKVILEFNISLFDLGEYINKYRSGHYHYLYQESLASPPR